MGAVEKTKNAFPSKDMIDEDIKIKQFVTEFEKKREKRKTVRDEFEKKKENSS